MYSLNCAACFANNCKPARKWKKINTNQIRMYKNCYSTLHESSWWRIVSRILLRSWQDFHLGLLVVSLHTHLLVLHNDSNSPESIKLYNKMSLCLELHQGYIAGRWTHLKRNLVNILGDLWLFWHSSKFPWNTLNLETNTCNVKSTSY